MPRSTSETYLSNPNLKRQGVKQQFTLKELAEFQKCSQDPIYFIKNYVKIINVDQGEIPFKMYDFQEKMVMNFVKNRFNIVKPLAVETPIHTTRGLIPLDDVKIGDYVFTPEGITTRVNGLTESRLSNDCYRITFDSGESIVADGDHIWSTQYHQWKTPRELTTKQMAQWHNSHKNYKSNPRLRIPIAKPIQGTQRNLPIDPFHYITDIQPVEAHYVKCIHIDTPDHLFLCGESGIPTHNCPRQVGKSITTCAFLLWTILFKEQQNIAILANKYQTAQKLLADLKKSYMQLPKWMQQGVVEWNKRNIELENGCKIVAAATAGDAIRGNAFNLIFLDEFAFVPGHIAEDFFKSVYPTISSGQSTKVIIVSTPNGMNMFHAMWTQAENPRNSTDPNIRWNGYEPFGIHWSMVPKPDGTGRLRDAAWKQETIDRTSAEQFRQEFECEFIGSSNTLIDHHKIEMLMKIWKSPSQSMRLNYSSFGNEFHNMDIHIPPQPNHQYVVTADVAGGKELDYSAFVIFDISTMPYQVVAKYKSNRIDQMLFPDVIAQAATKYNNAYILVETNDNDVAKTLQYQIGYENIITTLTKGGGTQVGGGFTKNVEFGLRSNRATKRIGCANLKTLIESDKLLVFDYQIITELSQFVSNTKGSFSAEEGKHDDLAMCLVNFGWLCNQQYFKELTETDVYNQLKVDYERHMDDEMVPFGIITSPFDQPDTRWGPKL
jgi:hypothetical protein